MLPVRGVVAMFPEKRKVGSSILPLTTRSRMISQSSHLRRQQEERDSYGAGGAREIQDQHRNNTTRPEPGGPAKPPRGKGGPQRPQGRPDGREARESARDPGRVVVEVGCGIVVYPPEGEGVRGGRCSPRAGGGGTGRR
jgi:hypothetical protein